VNISLLAISGLLRLLPICRGSSIRVIRGLLLSRMRVISRLGWLGLTIALLLRGLLGLSIGALRGLVRDSLRSILPLLLLGLLRISLLLLGWVALLLLRGEARLLRGELLLLLRRVSWLLGRVLLLTLHDHSLGLLSLYHNRLRLSWLLGLLLSVFAAENHKKHNHAKNQDPSKRGVHIERTGKSE